jgi:rhodanese-related sulfurtransferase
MHSLFRVIAPWCLLVSTALAADVPQVAPRAAAQLVAEGKAVLIDCREPKEWQETGVAAHAVLLAKSDFDGPQAEWKAFLERHAEHQILLYCRSGKRAGAIAAALAEKGLRTGNVGGLKDWIEAGLPTRAVAPEPNEPRAEKK